MTVLKLIVLLSSMTFLLAANSSEYTDWKMISAGSGITLGLTKDGSLYAWGGNERGQLGIQKGFWSSSVKLSVNPVAVMPQWKFKQIATGGDSCFAIRTDGSLYAWGFNGHSQLPIGYTLFGYESWPVRVGENYDWKEIAVGEAHGLALKNDGSLYIWGDNQEGALGMGRNKLMITTPERILPGYRFSSIAAAYRQSFAITKEGVLYAWGYNNIGQLGDNSTIKRFTPVRIGWDVKWRTVIASYDRTFALSLDGTLYTWGNKYYEKFDNKSLVPTKFDNRTDWKTITAGWQHYFGLTFNGSLFAWGDNFDGNLGDGTINNRKTPVQIAGNWSQISAGWWHSVGILSNNTVRAWGRNHQAKLGNDTIGGNIFRTVPGRVAPRITPSSSYDFYVTVSKTTLALYMSIIAAVLLLLKIVLCACVCRRKKTSKNEPVTQGTQIPYVTMDSPSRRSPVLVFYQANSTA